MKVTITEVITRKDLKAFITYPEKLYKGCANWVPSLTSDEYDTLGPKNAAFEFCEAKYWLARDEKGEVVGRVAGIINHNANKAWNKKNVRFGWIDFINDLDVLKALIQKVNDWGKEKGMTHIVGPLGFTDMDKEGLMVEGYENLSPFTCIYNYPYYGELLEKAGFSKEADWTQKVVEIPDQLPPMVQYADLVEKRFGLHVIKFDSMKEVADKYGMRLFHMYNETFAPLYEFAPLSDKQIEGYLKSYIPILNPKFVCLIGDENDNVAGFCICVPTLSKAIQKAHGRLFPFGFVHILKALRKNDTLEALMIGVLPEYQGKGASVLLFKHLHENCLKYGIKQMLANPQLETNFKVQSLWGDYPTRPYMRRRSYCKPVD